jgi:antitoxin component YwqK of YwqJK toxin-antitoxin module
MKRPVTPKRRVQARPAVKSTARAKAAPRAKKHLVYHNDGSIWARGQLRSGVMTGHWEWFRKDGTIMRSGSFENGEQTGTWTTYDKSGRVVKVTTMKRKSR